MATHRDQLSVSRTPSAGIIWALQRVLIRNSEFSFSLLIDPETWCDVSSLSVERGATSGTRSRTLRAGGIPFPRE